LPWDKITTAFSEVGTNVMVTVALWSLTEDLACLTFPVVNVVLPPLLAQAKQRDLVSKGTAHLITETGKVACMAVQYTLFRSYVVKPDA